MAASVHGWPREEKSVVRPVAGQPALVVEGYDAKTYGQKIADIYDGRHRRPLPGQVELLYELSGQPGGDRVKVTGGHFRQFDLGQLDLMARTTGLQLEGRWDGWDRRPYTATSLTTVSVWRAAR